MSERTDGLTLLYDDYCRLYGLLLNNIELLTEDQYNLMTKKLLENFRAEYELLALKNDIPYKQDMFETKVVHGTLVPRNRFLVVKNRSKKLTLKEIGAMLGEEFKAREEAYNAQYGDNKETDDPPKEVAETPADAATPSEKTETDDQPADMSETGQTTTAEPDEERPFSFKSASETPAGTDT